MSKIENNQKAGESSRNYQAGRDIVVHQGVSYADAHEIALNIFQAALPQLMDHARETARERAEEITDEFLDRLDSEQQDAFESLADPDVQVSLSEAQKGYARTGDGDLRESLVELLVRRVGEEAGNLRSIALNEAIASTPKLTEGQRRAIAWVFFVRHTRPANINTIDGFYAILRNASLALAGDVPKSTVDYQHIEYVGAGAVSVREFNIYSSLTSGVEGLFTTGFLEGEVEEGLWREMKDENLLQPCLRDPRKIQIRILGSEDVKPILSEHGLAHLESKVHEAMQLGLMDSESIEQEILLKVPEMENVLKSWCDQESALNKLTLTSVGIALGYAYWQRMTKDNAPLSMWL